MSTKTNGLPEISDVAASVQNVVENVTLSCDSTALGQTRKLGKSVSKMHGDAVRICREICARLQVYPVNSARGEFDHKTALACWLMPSAINPDYDTFVSKATLGGEQDLIAGLNQLKNSLRQVARQVFSLDPTRLGARLEDGEAQFEGKKQGGKPIAKLEISSKMEEETITQVVATIAASPSQVAAVVKGLADQGVTLEQVAEIFATIGAQVALEKAAQRNALEARLVAAQEELAKLQAYKDKLAA